MKRSTEDRLFARYCRSRSARALARLFDRTAPELWRVACHLTRDPDAADDLVQETFLHAIEAHERYDAGRPVVPWLLGILANLVRRRRRDQRRRRNLTLAELAQPGGDPLEAAQRRELASAMEGSLSGLPAPYREVLTLHLAFGLGPHAIAAQRGCPPSTVRNQVRRGMELLRRSLPASLAGGAVLALPRAGRLAPVRERILQRGVAPSASALVHVGSVLAMKKGLLVVASLMLVAGATGLLMVSNGKETPAASGGGAAAPEEMAHAATRAPAPLPAGGGAAPARTEVAGEPPGGLRVSVRYELDDTPAAGVGLYLLGDDDPGEALEQQTDAAGETHFEHLAAGGYLVQLDRGARARATVRAGAEVTLELAVPRGVLVRGRVVDVERHPVGGAGVYASRLTHPSFRQLLAVAADDGTFTARDVAPDTTLVAWAHGYQPSHPIRHRVRGRPGDTCEVVLRLGARAHQLRGRVVDARGRGVSHALVAIAADEDARKHPLGQLAQKYPSEFERPMDLESFLLRADGSGRFRTDAVPMGSTLVIARAPAHDGGVAAARTLVQPGADNAITLRLGAGATVQGRVVDEDGDAVSGLPVVSEWLGTLALGNLEHHVGHLVADRAAITDADGRFELRGLLAGPHRLIAGGFFSERMEIDDDDAIYRECIELSENQVLQWQAVVPVRHPLTVRVLDAKGAPLAKWAVHAVATGDGAPSHWPRTAADGRCLLLDVPPGAAQLALHAPQRGAPEPDLLPALLVAPVRNGDEQVIHVARPPAATVRGTLVGVDATKAHIALVREGWSLERRGRLRADGGFAFEKVPAGTYRLRVGGGATHSVDLGRWAVDGTNLLDVGVLRPDSTGVRSR